MATNVTQNDKTLQDVIEWCKSQRVDLLVTLADWPVSAAGNNAHFWNKGKLTAYTEVIRHCTAMLGYGGSMPLEVQGQAAAYEDIERKCRHMFCKEVNDGD